MAARCAQLPASRSRERQHGYSKKSSSLSTRSEQHDRRQHKYSFRCAAAAATGRIQKVGRTVARTFRTLQKGRQMAASIPLRHLRRRRVSRIGLGIPYLSFNILLPNFIPHLSFNILLPNFFTLAAWASSPAPMYLLSSTICPHTGELMYGADTIQDFSLRDLINAAAGSTGTTDSSLSPLLEMSPEQRVVYESTGRCIRASIKQRGGIGRLLEGLRAKGISVADGGVLDHVIVRGGQFADWMSRSLGVGWQGEHVEGDGGADELVLKRVREAVGSWFAGEGQEVVSVVSQEGLNVEVKELMVKCVTVVGLAVLGKRLWEGRRRW